MGMTTKGTRTIPFKMNGKTGNGRIGKSKRRYVGKKRYGIGMPIAMAGNGGGCQGASSTP